MNSYKCKNNCKEYKIGGKQYVGTTRSQLIIKNSLKYCKRCKVYFDTMEIRCNCCNLPLRNTPRNRYKKNLS